MRLFRAGLLLSFAVCTHSQAAPQSGDAAPPHLSIADFGLAYPLSSDWVRATELIRKRVEGASPAPNFDILLAAMYVPKSDLSANSPFFSLRAYRQPAADCRKNLEAMIANSQGKNGQPEGGVEQFSAAGRDYFRVNLAPGAGGRHQCIICSTSNGHLLVWNAGARNEQGLDAIVATLDSITALPQSRAPESAQSPAPKNNAEGTPSGPAKARPQKVRVSSGVAQAFLIKKVQPIYPDEARSSYIQGTVVLRAEIGKTGGITDLELLDGPIELAGSAVTAVRGWKYKPYLLQGEPIMVETQIQVNYALQR